MRRPSAPACSVGSTRCCPCQCCSRWWRRRTSTAPSEKSVERKREVRPCRGASRTPFRQPCARTAAMNTAALEACAVLVRRADPDRYFASLFAPAEARPYLFALYAFNHELARIGETVREPMMGQIRLQWWREAIEGARLGRPRRHDAVEALAELFRRHDVPAAPFDAMLAAREFDVSSDVMESF